MIDTDFFVPEEKHDRFVDCYQELVSNGGNRLKRSFKGGEDSYSRPRRFLSGGGGLCSTLADYANFCQMILNNGFFMGNQLLSPMTIEFMRKNHLPGNQTLSDMGDKSFSEVRYDGAGFGLGFSPLIDPVKASSPMSAGTISWGGMASTFFWIDSKENIFSILLTQLIPSGRYPIRPQAQTLVYSALRDLNKNY
jgi:CubicO group peptidase (beta-lactamase class C family)